MFDGFGNRRIADSAASTPIDRRKRFWYAGRRNSPPIHGRFAMAEYSKYQQKVIQRYYDNQDAILLQKLGEHVTELFLAEGKARVRRWKLIVAVLEKLKIPDSRIEHLQKTDNPALVAKLLEELLAKQK
jgi:hypothetical protein